MGLIASLQSTFHITQNYIESFFESESKFSRSSGYWVEDGDEKKEGFFEKLVPEASQRESWFWIRDCKALDSLGKVGKKVRQVGNYVAEPLCAASNVGFIYYGIKHSSPELLFAGAASFASHSVPKKWLLTVDKIGVLIVLSKAIFEYEKLLNAPWLLLPLAGAVTLNVADAHLARKHGYTTPHVIWHLGAAKLADIFYSAINTS